MADNVAPLHIRQNAPVVLLALGTEIVECGIVWCLLRTAISPYAVLIAHIAVAVSLCLYAWSLARKDQDLRLSLMLVSFTVFLGPLGGIATLAVVAMTSRFSSTARRFEEWYGDLFPEEAKRDDILDRLANENASGKDSVTPLIDVLNFGTHSQKQALITLMASNFRPAFAKVLKTALDDANNAIRVQAATAITRIEADFMRHTLEWTRAVEAQPNDADVLRSIARHYDDYAYIGLLDPARESECRAKALAYYKRYIQLAPSDREARLAVGRILLRGGDYGRGAAWFEEIENLETARSAEGSMWYMESLFHSGRLDQLRTLISEREVAPDASGNFPVEVLETLKLWSPS